MDKMLVLWSTFGALFGSLLTVIIESIIKAISARKEWKREITRTVVLRKLNVFEAALAEINDTINTFSGLRLLCNMNLNGQAEASLELVPSLQKASERMSSFERESKLIALEVYFDFSDLNNKFQTTEETIKMAKAKQTLDKVIASQPINEEMLFQTLKQIESSTQHLIEYFTAVKKLVQQSVQKYDV